MQIKIKNNLKKDAKEKDIIKILLRSRGLNTDAQVEEFLHSPEPTLKYLIKNFAVNKSALGSAKKLILDSIAKGKDICVFGDYDADGITATAILWQSLVFLARNSKARILPFIPDRQKHGYGLSDKAVKDIVSGKAFFDTAYPDFSPKLLITVDNGIVANHPVQILIEQGIEVIITDHHQPSSILPSANCLIHTTLTSGAGLSFVLALFITESAPTISSLIDLATIGVVADVLPLTGANRSLVVTGLRQLSSTNNLGLKSIIKLAKITDKTLSTYHINYCLAPRINAVGRLENPLDALRLLCSSDPKSTKKLAIHIDSLNQTRQELTAEALIHANKQPVDHKIVMVSSTSYHEGIIGLVAGKLAEINHKPAIVICMGPSVSKGSARSVNHINITDLLRHFDSQLLSIGGHELAAGFSIASDKIDKFQKDFYQYVDKTISDKDLDPTLFIDGVLSLKQTTKSLAKLIFSLEPFGMGNHKPRFVAYNLSVLEDRLLGKEGKHRRLLVEKDGITRQVIWFNCALPHPLSSIKELVFTLEINVWRDQESLQLNAKYVQTA